MLLSSRTCRPKRGSRKRTSRSPPGRQAKDQKPEEACPGPGAPGSTRARGRSPRAGDRAGSEGGEDGRGRERGGVDGPACRGGPCHPGTRVTPGPRRRGGPARRQGFRCALLCSASPSSASSESDGKASDIFNKESDTIRLLHRELRNPGRGRVWTLRGR